MPKPAWTVFYIDPATGWLNDREIEASDEREAMNLCVLRVIGHSHGPPLEVVQVVQVATKGAADE